MRHHQQRVVRTGAARCSSVERLHRNAVHCAAVSSSVGRLHRNHGTEGLTLVEVLVAVLMLALILMVAVRSIVQIGAGAESGNQDASLHMAMTRLIAQHPPDYTAPRTVGGRVSDLSGFDRLPERNRRILQASTFRAEIGNTSATYRIENPGELQVNFQRLSGAVQRF